MQKAEGRLRKNIEKRRVEVEGSTAMEHCSRKRFVQRNSRRFEREKAVQQVNTPRGFRQIENSEKIGTKKFHRLRIGDPKI